MDKAIIYLGYSLLVTFFVLVLLQIFFMYQDGDKLDASPTSANIIIILLMFYVRTLLKPELFSNNSQKLAIRIYKFMTLFIAIILIALILIVILYFVFFPMPLSN